MRDTSAEEVDAPITEPAGITAGRSMAHSEILARWARLRPDKAAFICDGQTVTYAEMDRRASVTARALAARGVGRGERVAMLMGNNLEFLEVLFGAWRIGAVAVPMSFRLAPAEVTFLIDDSRPTVLVVDDDFAEMAAAARSQSSWRCGCLVNGRDPRRAGPGAERYVDALATADGAPPQTVVGERDLACIMYTSGTTGRPKGAVLDHFNLFMNSVNCILEQQLWADDEVWYGVLPLFHIGGLNGVLVYLLLGVTSVVVPLGRFDAERAVDDLVRHRATSCCFVQMQWSEICAHLSGGAPPLALRRIVWGTSATVVSLLEDMARTFPRVPIYNFFGQTEMSSVTCVLRPEDFAVKAGSVGMPVRNVEARIVDDGMVDVTPGEVGEIVYRGPTVMRGYWGLTADSAEAFAGGWLHSGDLCRADDDGYLYVVDRKKDMIISGGENIYSAEVEGVLASHPKIAEVALIGVPDERWGEAPVAVVVPRVSSDPPSLEDLVEHCRPRLASYKKPKAVAIVDALPRNAAGKVVKPTLRERFSARG